MRWSGTKPQKEHFQGSRCLRTEAIDTVRIIRQNHALEHATITMLLPRLKRRVRLMGHAGLTGFTLYGNVPTEELEEAAREALRRLQKGERDLAISPMCGTNLAVAGLTAGVASMIAARGHTGLSKFSRVMQASLLGIIVAQPLGRLAQKHITTTSDLDNVKIAGVTKRGVGSLTRHKVTLVRF